MSTSPFSLAGHTAVITGAGRGLGKAIALGLHSAGANVVLGARTAAELDQTVAESRGSTARAIAVVTDIASRADCQFDRATNAAQHGYFGT